ncbi:MAG: Thiol-disulfide isomerase and thioredoxin [Firmicutes bacterium]|nr:Thiol-disulfide isomerase and thioredoxin [Bacillota bacterium]
MSKKIEILGTGCAKCQKLEANAKKAVELSGVDAAISKVTDINQIANYGVMITPALVLDGQVKVAGKIPTPEAIAEWLK